MAAHLLLADPVTRLSGVGPKLATQLGRLGVQSVGDLVHHTPLRYQRLEEVRPVTQWGFAREARIIVRIVKAHSKKLRRTTMTTALARDVEGTELTLQIFGRPWLARQLPGQTALCVGALTPGAKPSLQVKDITLLEQVDPAELQAGLQPIYRSTEGFSQQRLRALILRALDQLDPHDDPLPAGLLAEYNLLSLARALELCHRPEQIEDARRGRARLVFDELFPAQLVLRQLRLLDERRPALDCTPGSKLAAEVIAGLPFTLSPSQSACFTALAEKLDRTLPLRALLQGEVGSGKTAIAALCAARVAGAGGSAALLCPTELLARQHAQSLREMLEPAGLKVELLISAQPKREREAALARLQQESSHVAVGTHALLAEGSREQLLDRLALVIVDEQHRFGVRQRHELVEASERAGRNLHLLQLTATPIPRSLAMTGFGDLDHFALESRPDARRSVVTEIADEDSWPQRVRDAVDNDEGVFVICPLIGDSDEGLLSLDLARKLEGVSVAYAHGRQSSAERSQALEDFAARKSDVLIATTVIEVGIDIPHASLIVILGAERFGLAQLHQLRGRVGRAGQEATCLLVPSEEAPEGSLVRLQALVETDDGMELAERDLKLRGVGQLLGESQSGPHGFRIADLSRDFEQLMQAKDAAEKILTVDPELRDPDYAALRKIVAAQLELLLQARRG